jgi:DNA-binding response OmpR family regulator
VKKILVIEDHMDIRKLVQRTLEMLHHQVLLASSGASGSIMAQASKPDLVVLDLALPGTLNGLQVCRMLKARSPGMPVLLLCPQGQEEMLAAALNAGADAFLMKPFNPAQLMASMEQLLNPAAEAA